MRPLLGSLILAALVAPACAALAPAYPARPPTTPGDPIADPAPSRVVVHASVGLAALREALEAAIPPVGNGTYPLLGSERHYSWKRDPLAVRLAQGRVAIDLHVAAEAELPVGAAHPAFDVRVVAEPVVGADYVARLQSAEVAVTSSDRLVKLADATAGVLGKIRRELQARLDGFAYDLAPLVGDAAARVTAPIDLPLGDASGCAQIRLLGVEAGPTVLAGGIEKDLALVVAPSVTLPCTAPDAAAPGAPASGSATRLPPLANVASIPTGPFTVEVPIAARYDELARAMALAFTDGKLFFSKEYPGLWLERPEVYPSDGRLVLGVRIRGPVTKAGISSDLDGMLYLSGHPVVEDDELRVPDLEPTIDTANFFLKLKAALDGDAIRDQARAALRLDLGKRFAAVRDQLAKTVPLAGGRACLHAEAHRVHVASVHVHGDYLRVRVAVTAGARVELPCGAALPGAE